MTFIKVRAYPLRLSYYDMALICTTSPSSTQEKSKANRLSILTRRLRVASRLFSTIVQLLGLFGGVGIVPFEISALILVRRVQFAGLRLGVALSNLSIVGVHIY